METFLSFLDNNWPLVIAITTAVVGVAWGLFKRVAAASDNKIDDAIVRAIENNPLVVDKIARRLEEVVSDKLFGDVEVVFEPDTLDDTPDGVHEVAVETDPQPSGTR